MAMDFQVDDQGYLDEESTKFLQMQDRLDRFCAVNQVKYHEEHLRKPEGDAPQPYIATQAVPEIPVVEAPQADAADEEVEDEELDESDEDVPDYDESSYWKVADLKAELERRELPTNGNREALVARLREDDAAE